MPALDQTGPVGMGPMTGRGFGPCGLGLGWSRRFGAGRGLGRYFGRNFPQTKANKLKALVEYRKHCMKKWKMWKKNLQICRNPNKQIPTLSKLAFCDEVGI